MFSMFPIIRDFLPSCNETCKCAITGMVVISYMLLLAGRDDANVT